MAAMRMWRRWILLLTAVIVVTVGWPWRSSSTSVSTLPPQRFFQSVGLAGSGVDGDVQILGGPGLEHQDLAQPVVVLADDLNARHAVVVRDLLALPGLGDHDAGDQLHVLVPEPDQRLGNLAGLGGDAAVVEDLGDLAELSRTQRGHETARS